MMLSSCASLPSRTTPTTNSAIVLTNREAPSCEDVVNLCDEALQSAETQIKEQEEGIKQRDELITLQDEEIVRQRTTKNVTLIGGLLSNLVWLLIILL